MFNKRDCNFVAKTSANLSLGGSDCCKKLKEIRAEKEKGNKKKAFELIKEKYGKIDFFVHAIAFSDKNELQGRYVDTSRNNFLNTVQNTKPYLIKRRLPPPNAFQDYQSSHPTILWYS